MKIYCRPFLRFFFILGCFPELILDTLNVDYNTSLISNGVGNCYWNCKSKDGCGSTTNITFGLQVSEAYNVC